jgi:hypothetical protein
MKKEFGNRVVLTQELQRMRRTHIALLLIVFLLLGSQAFAQKFTGNIRGTVTDRTGATVPNASVTVIDTATGVTRTVNTNEQGEYAVLELPIGNYDVHIKQGQFKEFVTQAVAIHVSTTTTVNAELTPGMATEQVTVEAGSNAIQVETTTAAVGEVVNGQQVRELPLNGRSFAQLTQLQPGVSPANNFDTKNKGLLAGVDFSVNGNPTTNNLYLVDGANNNDVGSNRTILIYPSVESISEFKMLRNSYGPEYGQASGAVINIATRSGGNQFHGSAFYFGRNDLLNAHDYFAARAEASAEGAGVHLPNNGKDVLRRNDYGYSFGGPIKKDKLFFFWSQEWNKEKRGVTRHACVPTAAEEAGNFSTLSCGAPQPLVPGTKTPLTTIANPNPAGLLIAQLLPTPNLPSPLANGDNWSQSVTSAIDWRQENIRADYNLTKSNTVMFRYTQDHWQNPAPNLQGFWGDDPFPAAEGSWNQPSKQIVGKLTSTITSSMVNDVAFAYSNNRINITTGGTNPGLEAQISAAVPSIFPESLKNNAIGQPTLWGGLNQYGNGQTLWLISPWNNTLDIYTFRDDLSKVHGSHSFKMGAFFGYDGKNEDVGFNGQERPAFTADGANGTGTGNRLADILNPGTLFSMGESSTNTRAKLRWRDYEAYFGDTWRARRNLTLELGVRWSSLNSPYQADNRLTIFDPTLYDPTKPASDACNGLRIVPGTDPCGDANRQFGTNFSSGVPGVGRSLIRNNHHLFAPRVGVSWDPKGDGNTAIRLGAGQFYQRERVSLGYVGVQNAPFSLAANSVVRTLNANNAASGPPSGSISGGRDQSNLIPNSWQWNLTVEHSFVKDTALEVGYIGNRGIHLTSSFDANQVIGEPARVQEAFCSTCNTFRPFPNIGQITWFSHQGDSYYHALQTMFRTRVKRSQIQVAYTYSHSYANIELDNSSGGLSQGNFTDITNPGLDRGNSTINRPHIFVANAVINGPAFAGSNGFTKTTLGGWEFGIITTAASGNSVTVYSNGVSDGTCDAKFNNPLNIPSPCKTSLNSLSGTGYNNNQRPNFTGTSCNSGTSGDQIFNPAAFTLTGFQIGTVGNASRGSCQGPKLFDTDLALYKNFQATERLKIQFRLEAFNALNHANFRGDQINADFMAGGEVLCGNGTQACSPSNSVITSFKPNNKFGQANQTRGPREIQYALKFIF